MKKNKIIKKGYFEVWGAGTGDTEKWCIVLENDKSNAFASLAEGMTYDEAYDMKDKLNKVIESFLQEDEEGEIVNTRFELMDLRGKNE